MCLMMCLTRRGLLCGFPSQLCQLCFFYLLIFGASDASRCFMWISESVVSALFSLFQFLMCPKRHGILCGCLNLSCQLCSPFLNL
jgi:hypothetical protein